MVTRFAPSPTGLLHLGHAYAAIVASKLARQSSGTFLLRFEDIDHTRVRPEFYQAIEDDLRWLGLDWKLPALRQLERLDAYQLALDRLKAAGVVYPCFCTRREIDREIASMTRAPHGPEGPLYPGTCRRLDPARKDERLATGAEPAWRLDASACARISGPLTFTDSLQGTSRVDPTLLGDVILARRDIATSYHLAVVVDDAFQEITHVTRGEDLLASTHVHRLLQQILELPEPHYLHHPLVRDPSGQRLAKRHDALSIEALRAAGHSPSGLLPMMPPLP